MFSGAFSVLDRGHSMTPQQLRQHLTAKPPAKPPKAVTNPKPPERTPPPKKPATEPARAPQRQAPPFQPIDTLQPLTRPDAIPLLEFIGTIDPETITGQHLTAAERITDGATFLHSLAERLRSPSSAVFATAQRHASQLSDSINGGQI